MRTLHNNIKSVGCPRAKNLVGNAGVYRQMYANITQSCLMSSTANAPLKFSMMLANPDISPMRVVALYWIENDLHRQDFVVVCDTVFHTMRLSSDMLAEYKWVILPNGDVLDVS
jgi:hypothetical protein